MTSPMSRCDFAAMLSYHGGMRVSANRFVALGLACLCGLACTRNNSGASATDERPPAPTADAIPELTRVANDANAEIGARVAAVRDLGRVTDNPDAIEPVLRNLWTHTDHQLSAAAAAGVRRLDGHSTVSFARVAVIGASVSAGFMGSPVAVELERGLAGEPEMQNGADTFFFKAPFKNGERQVEAALAFKPSVVFALDFLFWYAYVAGADLNYRRSRVAAGLRLLERFEVPVIVGDIPDMRTAATWMLPESVVPPADHLQALNHQIRTWARDKLRVHLVPMATWARPLLTDGSVTDEGKTVKAAELLSPDGLHANARGVRYLLRRVDGELERAFIDTDLDALRVVN